MSEPARIDLVVVGSSLGGLEALGRLLHGLPEDFVPPIVVVQHRAPSGDSSLRQLVAARSALPVLEVEDRQALLGGHVHLAPADYHVIVEPKELALSTEAPVLHARPSIDVLFESAAHTYRRGVVGVVLTGASQDGGHGAAEIARRGGRVLVQDPATARSPVAPESAIASAPVELVGEIEELAQWLRQHAEPLPSPQAPARNGAP